MARHADLEKQVVVLTRHLNEALEQQATTADAHPLVQLPH
jgi:hypothetical protein